MRPDTPRALTAGPDGGPEPPFPLRLNGRVVKGFGRGSSELGIPTANIPIAGLSVGGHADVESGVYFGWAGLDVDEQGNRIPLPLPPSSPTIAANNPPATATSDAPTHLRVYPMVMSIGWNPFYRNTVRSVEVHLLHDFAQDFYGAWMNLLIVGFIRPEYDYVSRDALIEDIRMDIEVARRSLARDAYAGMGRDAYLDTAPEGEAEAGS